MASAGAAGSAVRTGVEPVSPPPGAKSRRGRRKAPKDGSRVLVVHRDVGILRMVRESLQDFTRSEVDTTPDAVYGFEMALQREYDLFVFGLALPAFGGDVLYELIAKAYAHAHAGARAAPAVVFVLSETAAGSPEELRRDARVKGFLPEPFEIERLLEQVDGSLQRTSG